MSAAAILRERDGLSDVQQRRGRREDRDVALILQEIHNLRHLEETGEGSVNVGSRIFTVGEAVRST